MKFEDEKEKYEKEEAETNEEEENSRKGDWMTKKWEME